MAVLRMAYLDESGKENDQEEELGKARDLCAPILNIYRTVWGS